jgi:outer membrane immunogenic protein
MQRIEWMSVPVVALTALAAGPAIGADLPFTWTGFYIGGNVGGGWAQGNVTDTVNGASFGSGTVGAFVGGGQVGFNYQVGYLVLGVEGFFDGIASGNNNNSNIVAGLTGDQFQANANARWVATAAGRVGFTGPGFDHWLFYAKGGGGWVGYDASVTDVTTGIGASTSNSLSGWMAGGGIEWAFANNWTARVDYQYIGLNNFTVGSFPADRFMVNNPNVQTVTVGINYLFH